MKRLFVVLPLLLVQAPRAPQAVIGTAVHDWGGDPNAYFSDLLANPAIWKSYALRSDAEINLYHNSGSTPGTSYDAAMDAMKVVIPPFRAATTATLLSDLDAGTTLVPLSERSWDSAILAGGLIKVDEEVMTVTRVDTAAKTATVSRGQWGTAAARHAAGVRVYPSTNSLQNQVRLPLGTTDGHKYVITWDVYYTRSWIHGNDGKKAFQLSSGGDAIWLETQLNQAARYSPGLDPGRMVGGVTLRSYNVLGGDANWALTDGNHTGPGVTKNQILQPASGNFLIQPERWVRYWALIDQRANDYDYVDFWVADAKTGPVHVYTHLPVSVRPTGSAPNQIVKFWVEMNSSQDRFVRGDLRDIVAYVRNVAVLRDPADVQALLRRPTGQ